MAIFGEPSGAEHTEKKCAPIPGSSEDEIAKLEKSQLLIAMCYKALMAISTVLGKFKILMPMFDTGAGPNSIWKYVVPTA